MDNRDDLGQNSQKDDNVDTSDDLKGFIRLIEQILTKLLYSIYNKNIENEKNMTYNVHVTVDKDGVIKAVHRFECLEELDIGSTEPMDGQKKNAFVDIIEYEDEIAVTLEIRGFEEQNIFTDVFDNMLIVSVSENDIIMEKTINLPCAVEAETLIVSFHQGVLDIRCKKK